MQIDFLSERLPPTSPVSNCSTEWRVCYLTNINKKTKQIAARYNWCMYILFGVFFPYFLIASMPQILLESFKFYFSCIALCRSNIDVVGESWCTKSYSWNKSYLFLGSQIWVSLKHEKNSLHEDLAHRNDISTQSATYTHKLVFLSTWDFPLA